MLNVAVIGAGYWGVNYVRLLHELPTVKLLAVCEPDPARAAVVRQRFPLVPVIEQVDEVLGNRWVDAVVVATPATTHHAVVKKALLAGKHAMVEKPLTTTVADAEDLVRTAAQQQRKLMVGLTFLYNPGIRKMKRLMEDAAFGRTYYIHSTRTNLGPVRPDVSVTWDLASHDISICDYLLNSKPRWVQANAATVLDHELHDVAFVTLGYPGNIIANIHVSWVDPNKVREVVVVGSNRRIVFDDLNTIERVRIFEKGISSQSREADTFGEFRLLVRDGDIISPKIEPSEPLRNQVEEFVRAISSDCDPFTGGDVGLANVRTLVAIDRSLDAGGARVEIQANDSSNRDS